MLEEALKNSPRSLQSRVRGLLASVWKWNRKEKYWVNRHQEATTTTHSLKATLSGRPPPRRDLSALSDNGDANIVQIIQHLIFLLGPLNIFKFVN